VRSAHLARPPAALSSARSVSSLFCTVSFSTSALAVRCLSSNSARALFQGLTLVQCSAQLEPCLKRENTLHTLKTSLVTLTFATQTPCVFPYKALKLSWKVDECKPLPCFAWCAPRSSRQSWRGSAPRGPCSRLRCCARRPASRV
jgi:hypothetical protein